MKRRVFLYITVCVTAATLALGDYVYEGQWGSEGSGSGQFDRPREVALAPNGNVYVIDTYNNRVQYFTPTGNFIGAWGRLGSGDGYF